MRRHEKNAPNGACSAKTGKDVDLQGTRLDDPCEDLLDAPLPAG